MNSHTSPHFERHREPGLLLSSDPLKLDFDAIERFTRDTYWAPARPRDVIERSFANSLSFGLYNDGRQIGMCRFVTDYETFAWFCDVYIDPPQRDKGLAQWMVTCAHEHPAIAKIRLAFLGTRDAHALYRKAGYVAVPAPERWMERRSPVAKTGT